MGRICTCQGMLLFSAKLAIAIGIHSKFGFNLSNRSSTNIPDEVAAALVDAFAKEGGLTETEAKAYLTDLERKGRFQQECWS